MRVILKIENPTGNMLATKIQGERIEIPANSVGDDAVVKKFPDSTAVRKWINYVTSTFRAVRVTVIGGESDATIPEGPIGGVEPPGDPQESSGGVEPPGDPQESSGGVEPPGDPQGQTEGGDAIISPEQVESGGAQLSLDDFVSKSSASKGSGGWWAVTCEGINEPIKVRGGEDEDSAILEAYEKYIKG